jgi:hypothetical protein
MTSEIFIEHLHPPLDNLTPPRWPGSGPLARGSAGNFHFDGELTVGTNKGQFMLGTILIIVLILLLLGALPSWPYSGGWGYYPSSGLGLILIIVVVLVLIGRL